MDVLRSIHVNLQPIVAVAVFRGQCNQSLAVRIDHPQISLNLGYIQINSCQIPNPGQSRSLILKEFQKSVDQQGREELIDFLPKLIDGFSSFSGT